MPTHKTIFTFFVLKFSSHVSGKICWWPLRNSWHWWTVLLKLLSTKQHKTWSVLLARWTILRNIKNLRGTQKYIVYLLSTWLSAWNQFAISKAYAFHSSVGNSPHLLLKTYRYFHNLKVLLNVLISRSGFPSKLDEYQFISLDLFFFENCFFQLDEWWFWFKTSACDPSKSKKWDIL